jgi:hypothetical protein
MYILAIIGMLILVLPLAYFFGAKVYLAFMLVFFLIAIFIFVMIIAYYYIFKAGGH